MRTLSSLLAPAAMPAGVQVTLVSGTNIKTINGTTLLGAGDIVITGGLSVVTVAGTTQGVTINSDYSPLNADATVFIAPATATAGDKWAVTVTNGRIDNSVNWNGLKHQGLSDTTMTMDAIRTWNFKYINASFGWKVD